MSLLAEFESSVADLRRMAGQSSEVRADSGPEHRPEQVRQPVVEHGNGQNAVIRTELDELRNTLSRRALEMDQRAFDLERRRRELEEEAERLRQSIAEQVRQTQIRESLLEKHESEFAGRLTQLTGQAQESERSRVLAEEKLKATELARSQAEARARELESQITATRGGGAEIERKLLELSNRIAQAEAEVTERRRKGALDAELLLVAEQKRVEAEARSEASRQTLWVAERELGELRDRAARQNASNICDLAVKQAVVDAQARIMELERDVWLRQQEVDRARDERAEAMKDAERASDLAAKSEAVAQHTIAAVETLRQQVSARTAELEAERVTLQHAIAALQAELEAARSGVSDAASHEIAEFRQKAAEREAALEADLKIAAAVAESERSARAAAESAIQQIREDQTALSERLSRVQAEADEATAALARSSTNAGAQQEHLDKIRDEAEAANRAQAQRLAELESELRNQQEAYATAQEQWRAEHDAQQAAHRIAQEELARELDLARQQAAELAQARTALESASAQAARSLDDARSQHARAVAFLNEEIESARKRLDASEQSLANADRLAAQLEQRAESLQQERDQLRLVATNAQQELDGLNARNNVDRATIGEHEERSRVMQTKLDDALKANQEFADRVAKAERTAQEARAEHEHLCSDVERTRERTQDEIAALEQQITQQREIITALNSSTDNGQAQAAKAQEARVEAERLVLELQAKCNELADRAARERETAESQAVRLRETVMQLEERVGAERAEAQSRLQETQSELQSLRAKLSQIQAGAAEEHARLEAECQSKQEECARLLAEQADAKADLARLSGAQSDQVAHSQQVITQLRNEIAALQSSQLAITAALEQAKSDGAQREQELLAKVQEACAQKEERERVLLAEIEAVRSCKATDEHAAAVSAQTQQWEEERDALRRQADAAQQQSTELEATVAKLVERLKTEVQARRQSEQHASAGAANHPSDARVPESRQERMRLHRRLRRQQMEQIREAGEVLRKRFEICEQVLTQRAQLAAAHQVIQETQKKQASQKAVGRAAMVMGHGMIVLAILAGLSWAVAGQVAPGRFAARATLEADGKGRELAHDELKEWQKFHEDMLNDPQFASKVAEHMKRFGMGAMAEPGAVAERLKSDMSFESARPGVLTVELRGDGPERTARELNAITTKLAAEAVEARARRIDGAVTIIAKEAAADPTPIDSKRLQMAGTILGGCAAFGIFVATFIYRRLAAAKQKFERDIALEAILDAARWPSAVEKSANENAAPTRKAA